MKNRLYILALFWLISHSVSAQLVLCEDQKAEILRSGERLVVDYTRLIETLTITSEFEIQQKIQEKIFELVENREIQVEDDLTEYAHQGRRFDLENYLSNINYHSSPTTEVYYQVKAPEQVYYHPDQKFYYTTVEVEKIAKKPAGESRYLENFVVKIDQIDKNLPILRISDITLKRPNQMIIGNVVQTRTCLREVRPLAFQLPQDLKFRRGNDTPYPLEWDGGILEDSLLIEMVRFNRKNEIIGIDTLLNEYQNKGYFTQWYIPQTRKPGAYKLRMTKLNQNEPPVWSENFKIKRKIPLAYKIGIPVAVGVGVYFLQQALEEEPPLSPLPAVPGLE